MMKKTLVVLILLFASVRSEASFDAGVLAGLSASSSISNPAFTYGLTASYDLNMLSIGLKAYNFSLANSSQLNIFGQIKKYFGGFFVGLNIGPGITSVTGLNNITSAMIGPTAGMYFGTVLKFGIEVDYNLSTQSGSVGTFVPMAGVKIAL